MITYSFRKWRIFLLGSGLLILLFLFPTAQYCSYLLYPILKLQSWVISPVKNMMQTKKTMQELQQQVTVLCEQQEQLLEENIALRAQLTYVADIKELQEYNKRFYTAQGMITQVMGHICNDQSQTILIDVGKNNGIKEDMIVVHKNCVVGKVTTVYPWYSKVTLITDKSCKVSAFCSTTGARGIHEGTNKMSGTLHYVSHLDEVIPGDIILSSGEGLIFPRGLALGKIVSGTKKELYYSISVTPMIDINTLEYCTVLSKDAFFN